jgi:hypothetical protein
MSVSPSFPHGAPSLAEVLLQRTFAKPPKPFVDGEFLKALEHADDDAQPTDAAAAKPAAVKDAGPSIAPVAKGSRVDVRA